MPTTTPKREARVSFGAWGGSPEYSPTEAEAMVADLERDQKAALDAKATKLDPEAIWRKWNKPRPPGAERL